MVSPPGDRCKAGPACTDPVFHIKELDRAGLVAARQDGRFIHYSANFAAMRELVDFLSDHCCSLADALAIRIATQSSSPYRKKRA